MTENAPVPLVELVLEGLGISVVEVERQLAADELVTDDVGRPCASRQGARRLFNDRAKREATAAARLREPTEHDRWLAAFTRWNAARKARAAANEPQAGEVIGDGLWLSGVPAEEGLTAADQARAAHLQAKVARKSDLLDELWDGDLTYHPASRERQPVNRRECDVLVARAAEAQRIADETAAYARDQAEAVRWQLEGPLRAPRTIELRHEGGRWMATGVAATMRVVVWGYFDGISTAPEPVAYLSVVVEAGKAGMVAHPITTTKAGRAFAALLGDLGSARLTVLGPRTVMAGFD